MQLTKFLAILVALSLSASLLAQNTVTYSTPEYDLDYPENWELDESKTKGPAIFFFSPVEDEEDQFRENVNIMVQDLSGTGLDFKGYIDLSKDQFKGFGAKVYELRVVEEPTDGVQEAILSYAMEQFGLQLRCYQRLKMIDDTAYLITFTAEEDNYETFLKEGKNLLNSFSLKLSESPERE